MIIINACVSRALCVVCGGDEKGGGRLRGQDVDLRHVEDGQVPTLVPVRMHHGRYPFTLAFLPCVRVAIVHVPVCVCAHLFSHHDMLPVGGGWWVVVVAAFFHREVTIDDYTVRLEVWDSGTRSRRLRTFWFLA
jgi:hypothetical protein